MNSFVDFYIIGDPVFDLFFSIPASLSILFFLLTSALSLFRGR